MLLSSLSISVENLFTIRPSGVVSKKDIGALKIVFSSRKCKTLEAITPAKKMPTENRYRDITVITKAQF